VQERNNVMERPPEIPPDEVLDRLFPERRTGGFTREGPSFIESPLIGELLRQAKAEAKADTELETAARLLLRVLQKRYGELPEDLVATIRACTESAQLDHWLDVAVEAQTLERFRLRTNLLELGNCPYATAVLRVVQKRYGHLPKELTAAVRACTESVQLDHWLDVALEAATLERFRQQTGL
jgi:hypothetical protein